jgi:hypothetical protein
MIHPYPLQDPSYSKSYGYMALFASPYYTAMEQTNVANWRVHHFLRSSTNEFAPCADFARNTLLLGQLLAHALSE